MEHPIGKNPLAERSRSQRDMSPYLWSRPPKLPRIFPQADSHLAFECPQ
jgi:hypothetical protein